jgi:hypothetical protein
MGTSGHIGTPSAVYFAAAADVAAAAAAAAADVAIVAAVAAADEDEMVTDPDLNTHLAHWGINMLQVSKGLVTCGV